MNQVGHVFSMADVQRQYDPFLPASEADYGLQQFFLNGGTEAYIVRVAAGSPAQVAAIDLMDSAGGTRVLRATATSEGVWCNNIRIDLDCVTTDPTTSFNPTVSEILDAYGGTTQVVSQENHVHGHCRRHSVAALGRPHHRGHQRDHDTGPGHPQPVITASAAGHVITLAALGFPSVSSSSARR